MNIRTKREKNGTYVAWVIEEPNMVALGETKMGAIGTLVYFYEDVFGVESIVEIHEPELTVKQRTGGRR